MEPDGSRHSRSAVKVAEEMQGEQIHGDLPFGRRPIAPGKYPARKVPQARFTCIEVLMG